MPEGEFNPEFDPETQQVKLIEGLLTEGKDKEATKSITQAVRELTREGKTEEAIRLVEMLAGVREKLPADLQPHFDNAVGEANLYASDFDKAETSFSDVASNKLPELPPDEKQISPEQMDAYSRTIHAQGRLGDTAFLRGEFALAGERFGAQVETQEKYSLEPAGPRACAQYGQAASAFMAGELETCKELLATAKTTLEDATSNESALLINIENLEAATETMSEFSEVNREARLEAMKATLMQRGGGQGGVKRINFRELYDEATAELEIDGE
jgi:hypothetical protein